MNKLALSIGLMIVTLFSTNAICDSTNRVETVPKVDLSSYLGTWYEIASIPQSFQKDCIADTQAEYSVDQKGRIDVKNSCLTAEEKIKVAKGKAKVVDTNSNAKLKVTFVKLGGWIFAFGGNYWVIGLGENYQYAIVGEPSREYLWVLSRTPDLTPDDFESVINTLKVQGYDLSKILTSIQTQGEFKSRIPLSELL